MAAMTLGQTYKYLLHLPTLQRYCALWLACYKVIVYYTPARCEPKTEAEWYHRKPLERRTPSNLLSSNRACNLCGWNGLIEENNLNFKSENVMAMKWLHTFLLGIQSYLYHIPRFLVAPTATAIHSNTINKNAVKDNCCS